MTTLFDTFFQGQAKEFLIQAIDLALAEDGPDLTSMALFKEQDLGTAKIMAKEQGIIAGLPIIPLIFSRLDHLQTKVELLTQDGKEVHPGQTIAQIKGPVLSILKAERVILNFLTHLSGIATLTRSFVQEMQPSRTTLLDTRKTLPGLRHVEKYAVRIGGGHNHRLNLSELLMLKDNHIDQAGSITAAVHKLKKTYTPCPPIEVECRDLEEVQEASRLDIKRIMLDNMSPEQIQKALKIIPQDIETEISGGINLKNIKKFASLGADFISVGCLTNSAKNLDLSLYIPIRTNS